MAPASVEGDASLALIPRAGSSPAPKSLDPYPSLLVGDRPVRDINFMARSLPDNGGYIRKDPTQFPV